MSSSLATYWRRMASGHDRGVTPKFIQGLLYVPSVLYGSVQKVRAGLFKKGIMGGKRLPKPVISVGNITVGGTGKTPVTALIAGMLLEQGMRVAVLSRGYGGSSEGKVRIVSDGKNVFMTARECGDEPFLLASTIPGLMVVIGSDRHAAGQLALQELQPDLFLLDDGFQHLRLHRDLNILLLDYARPYGNGLCLPAGLLREPECAVQRADLVIHTRCPEGRQPESIIPEKPNWCARHLLRDLIPLHGGVVHPYSVVSGKKVFAVAGIAEPDFFFTGLLDNGVELVATLSLPDHADYDADTLQIIEDTFESSGADLLLTTEKDGVKLTGISDVVAEKILVCRLSLQLDDPALLAATLRNLLQK